MPVATPVFKRSCLKLGQGSIVGPVARVVCGIISIIIKLMKARSKNENRETFLLRMAYLL